MEPLRSILVEMFVDMASLRLAVGGPTYNTLNSPPLIVSFSAVPTSLTAEAFNSPTVVALALRYSRADYLSSTFLLPRASHSLVCPDFRSHAIVAVTNIRNGASFVSPPLSCGAKLSGYSSLEYHKGTPPCWLMEGRPLRSVNDYPRHRVEIVGNGVTRYTLCSLGRLTCSHVHAS